MYVCIIIKVIVFVMLTGYPVNRGEDVMDCVYYSLLLINYFVLVRMLSWVCIRKIQSIERSSLTHLQIFPTLLQLYDIF